jgi:hypothetical protein
MLQIGGQIMNGHQCCCDSVAADSNQKASVVNKNKKPGRRYLSFSRWIVPGVMFALVPKCPLCLAAYVALGTGVSLSLHTATWIRWIIIILCVGSFLYLVATSAMKVFRKAL